MYLGYTHHCNSSLIVCSLFFKIYLIYMITLVSWGGKYDVGRWVLRLWYVEYDNSDIPLKLWKSSRSDNLTSVKWNRHYIQLVEGPPANQGRSLPEKWSWFIVKVVERNSWACSPCYQLSIILLTMTMVMTRTMMYEVGVALLLSTIYYPADQLYGPHCCPWEGGNTRHLPHFWKWTEINFWHFFFCFPSYLWHKCCSRVSRRNMSPKRYVWKRSLSTKKNIFTN